MKTACIVSEYNPFHNGHKYQIDVLKKEYDAVLAIMSGNFVQRGGIAVTDKWTRAKTALLNGVDLVIELPVCYSLNTAERFSYGAVFIADSTGVADCLCFGSEYGEIDEFIKSAELLNNEPLEISEKISGFMKEGLSYPVARERAYDGFIKNELLNNPNNILGLEYVRALKKINSKIIPKTIKRIGAGYNETGYTGEFNSATGIRELMMSGKDYRKFMPESAWEVIESSVKFYEDELFDILKFAAITGGLSQIEEINDVSEGLENKIYRAIKEGKSFFEVAELIKSKRYTMSRIRRILFSIILDLKKDMSAENPQYIRVLGMNDCGKKLLKEMKEKATLPVIIKTADFSSPMLSKDILATDVSYLSTKEKTLGMDFLTSPVII